MKTQDERIDEICQNLANLLKRKNADYDDSFTKQFEKYGVLSSMIRIEDKFNRLNNLVVKGNGTKLTNESIDDTLLDLSGYCILTLIERDKEKEKQL
jgi:hypothetical protein